MAMLSEGGLKDYYFVSYDHEDHDFVNKFVVDLRHEGLVVWIDTEDLQPGLRNWEDSIRKIISKTSSVILIASPSSRQSRYVQDELAIAEMYDIPIVPVWARGMEWIDSVAMGMGKTQYIDARTEEDYKQAVKRMVPTLTKLQSAANRKLAEIESSKATQDKAKEDNVVFQPRNPYKGLRAFREDEQQDFFGRNHFLEELLNTITRNQHERILPIIGPSGSGKSSLVIAGLLPRLHKGDISGSDHWYYLPAVVPGTHPLEKLIVALKTAVKDSFSDIQKDLENPNARGLHLRASQIASEHGSPRVVLYIDQFEELFTQLDADKVEQEAEREQFINLLVAAVSERSGPLIVILSMRADFYDRPMNYPGLGKLIETHGRSVLPLSVAELYEVVQKPASLSDVRLSFEEGLQAELVFEIRDQLGGLPLLQFTLHQLFNHREGQRLTMDAYHKIGGVRGALARHAEATYEGLGSDDYKALARGLFLRLIEPGLSEMDTTRRRASIDEFHLSNTQQTTNMQHVIDTFVNARLLVTDQGLTSMTIEVSHEALIREWKRLNGWLDEARNDVQLQQEISADGREWVLRNHPPDRLYRGSQLHDALEWMRRSTPSQKEMEFLEASRRAQQRFERGQRFRTYTILTLVIGILAVIVGALFFSNYRIQDTLAQSLPLLANEYVDQNNIPDAVDFALRGLESHQTHFYPIGQAALINALAQPWQSHASAFAISEQVTQMWWNSDNTRFLTLNAPEASCDTGCIYRVQLWDQSGNLLPVQFPTYEYISSVQWAPVSEQWNPDESYILISSQPAESTDCQTITCSYKLEVLSDAGDHLIDLANYDNPIVTSSWDDNNDQILTISSDCEEDCVLHTTLSDLRERSSRSFSANVLDFDPTLHTVYDGYGNANVQWLDNEIIILYSPDYYYSSSNATTYVLLLNQQQLIPIDGSNDREWTRSTWWSQDYRYAVVLRRASNCDTPPCPSEMSLWDSAGNKIAGPLPHANPVESLFWNDTGDWFAVVTNSPTSTNCHMITCAYEIRTWDNQGNSLGDPQVFNNTVSIFTDAPNPYYGNRIGTRRFFSISQSSEENDCGDSCVYEMRVWDNEGHVVAGTTLRETRVISVIWNPTGTRFLVFSTASSAESDCAEQTCISKVELWDNQGNLIAEPQINDAAIYRVSWNRNGTYFAMISTLEENPDCAHDRRCEYHVQVWDDQGNTVSEPQIFNNPVSPRWNEQGNQLTVVNSYDNCPDGECLVQVSIWNIGENDDYPIESVNFSGSFSVEAGNRYSLWDQIWNSTNDLLFLRYYADSTYSTATYVISLQDGNLIELADNVPTVYSIEHESNDVYTVSVDGMIQIWNPEIANYRPFDASQWTDSNTLIWYIEYGDDNSSELVLNMVEGDPSVAIDSGYGEGIDLTLNNNEEPRYLLVSAGDEIAVWDIERQRANGDGKILSLAYNSSYDSSIQWHTDGEQLVLYDSNRPEVQLIPLDLESLIRMGRTHLSEIREAEATAEATEVP